MAQVNLSAAEYQLIEHVRHGIVGRIYSPRPMNTKKSQREIIRTERNNQVVYFKTTVQDHLAIAQQCRSSNIAANRIRTNSLLMQMKQGKLDPMARPAIITPPPSVSELVEEVPTEAAVAALVAQLPAVAAETETLINTGSTAPVITLDIPAVTIEDEIPAVSLAEQLKGYSLKELRALCTELGATSTGKSKAKLIRTISKNQDDARLFDYYLNASEVAA